MFNKLVRNSVVSMLAISVIVPTFALAKDSGSENHVGIGAKINAFLHIPSFGKLGSGSHELEVKGKIESKASKSHDQDEDQNRSFPGSVVTVASGSFTVLSENGKNSVKVDVNSSTKYKNGQKSDIIVGTKVIVRGTWNSGKTEVTAKEIQVVGGKKSNPIKDWFRGLFSMHFLNGIITAISGNNVTVKNDSNVSYNVNIAGAKLLAPNPFKLESASDLKVGDHVQVFGNIASTSVTADIVHDLTASH